MDKVVSQDKRHALPVDSKFPLEVAQEMAKVDVEELRRRDENHLWLTDLYLKGEANRMWKICDC